MKQMSEHIAEPPGAGHLLSAAFGMRARPVAGAAV
jgi:hypothetical protein